MRASMEWLPEGLLENVLLRLPLVDLPTGKQVCKHWKRLIESIGFRRAYRTKPVALLQSSPVDIDFVETRNLTPGYRFVDRGSNTTLWSGRNASFGAITAHINGLLMAGSDHKYYIGNPFINKWEEFECPKLVYEDETGIFPLDNGRFKLVCWKAQFGEISTFAAGQPEWSVAKPHDEPAILGTYTNAVVMSDRDHVIFRVRHSDGMLMEFDTISGNFSSTRITNADKEEELEFYYPIQSARLLALQGMLYLLMLAGDGDRLQTVDIWRISPGDASATFVRLIEMEKPDDLIICELDGLIRFQGFPGEDNTVNQLVYNVATNTLQQSEFNAHTLWIEEKVAVRLEFDRFL